MEILLQPFGGINSVILGTIKHGFLKTFGCPVTIKETLPVPSTAFDQGRDQYLADVFLNEIKPYCPQDGKILAIADVDLFSGTGNFVFGLADGTAGTAVISLYLLRQEGYGLPEDLPLFQARALKEAIHEIGHTFGIDHCDNGGCVMFYSSSLMDTDLKSTAFCPSCRPRLQI
jgi:archaemetzincin